MDLEEMKKEIEKLVLEKGFYNEPEDIPKKLLFAFVELGEASDAWKKGRNEAEIAEGKPIVVIQPYDEKLTLKEGDKVTIWFLPEKTLVFPHPGEEIEKILD